MSTLLAVIAEEHGQSILEAVQSTLDYSMDVVQKRISLMKIPEADADKSAWENQGYARERGVLDALRFLKDLGLKLLEFASSAYLNPQQSEELSFVYAKLLQILVGEIFALTKHINAAAFLDARGPPNYQLAGSEAAPKQPPADPRDEICSFVVAACKQHGLLTPVTMYTLAQWCGAASPLAFAPRRAPPASNPPESADASDSASLHPISLPDDDVVLAGMDACHYYLSAMEDLIDGELQFGNPALARGSCITDNLVRTCSNILEDSLTRGPHDYASRTFTVCAKLQVLLQCVGFRTSTATVNVIKRCLSLDKIQSPRVGKGDAIVPAGYPQLPDEIQRVCRDAEGQSSV
ncbi:hypothetical protein HK104_007193 [Borealophlyctis nickersoniae]|nr:hypothetical protein HK104_007193 [Borealophlyctis nickersoniae]